MSWWLTRKPDKPDKTMLDFWRDQDPTSSWRSSSWVDEKLAARVGGLMLSQCATEQANKYPKQVWTAERRSVTVELAMWSFTRIWLIFPPPYLLDDEEVA